MIKILFLIKVI